jgi:hypothetical protein
MSPWQPGLHLTLIAVGSTAASWTRCDSGAIDNAQGGYTARHQPPVLKPWLACTPAAQPGRLHQSRTRELGVGAVRTPSGSHARPTHSRCASPLPQPPPIQVDFRYPLSVPAHYAAKLFALSPKYGCRSTLVSGGRHPHFEACLPAAWAVNFSSPAQLAGDTACAELALQI